MLELVLYIKKKKKKSHSSWDCCFAIQNQLKETLISVGLSPYNILDAQVYSKQKGAVLSLDSAARRVFKHRQRNF